MWNVAHNQDNLSHNEGKYNLYLPSYY